MKKTLILLAAILSLPAYSGVSDMKNSSSAGRLDQVSDTYTPTPAKPSYQPDSVGGAWTPDINLNNAKGALSSNVTGTPKISLNNAYGSIAGTSGTNSSINSTINSAVASNSSNKMGSWVRTYQYSFQGFQTQYSNGPTGSCVVGQKAFYYYHYESNNDNTTSHSYQWVCQ